MSFFMEEEDWENEGNFEQEAEYGIRNGILFVIDCTLSMFENDPNEGIPYFRQCIQLYKEIIKQKLVWNRQDWMGLILFGTDEWDANSEMKHILTVQQLSLVSVDHLKEIMNIDEGNSEKNWQYYKSISSVASYPLHDVLWHVARVFSSVTVTMATRKVMFFSCQDTPPMTDNNEKHRIRVKASSYADIGLQLFVIGLGDHWDHNKFYKDLEILSKKIDSEDYKRTSLKDLVVQVKLPSRNMAKLPWRLGEGVVIDVSLHRLSVKREYLKKYKISKETNVPLISHSYWKLASNKDNDDEGSQRPPSPVLETEIKQVVEYGERRISFTSAEMKFMSVTRDPGIDLICVKPISYHPLYHFEGPYFVVPTKKHSQDNKLLFAALLNKLLSMNLMMVCTATIRKQSVSSLYVMIPNAKSGGFYLYKVPYRETIKKFNNYFSERIYDDEHKPPVDENAVELLVEMMDKLKVKYDPEAFTNPKLRVQLQMIETLALDLEQPKLPLDTTLSKLEEMRGEVEDLLQRYDEIFPVEIDEVIPKKRAKKTNEGSTVCNLDDETIRQLVKRGKIDSMTIPQLKEILKKIGLKLTGRKDELISRINEFYN